jgi:hypothetical protein
VTDDSKEHRFNLLIRNLKESGFTISEEKHIIVTSEFYAKIFSPDKSLPAIELISYPNLGDGVMFQIKLDNLKDQFAGTSIGDLKNRIELESRMKEMFVKNGILLSNTDEELMIQKIFSVDPQKTGSKFEILKHISLIQSVTKNIEEWLYLYSSK